MQEQFQFNTSAHAKCILAGEHAVMRGRPAIVLPVIKKNLVLNFYPEKQSIKSAIVSANDESGTLFLKTLQNGLQRINKKFPQDIHGEFELHNQIAIGAGIGFSAALCVVISRWLAWKQWIKNEDVFQFARQLENLHHGRSSGIDIVGAMWGKIVLFSLSSGVQEIEVNWQPKLYISYSGFAKNTKEAVERIDRLRESSPKLAHLIDDEMEESVNQIKESLKKGGSKSLQLLISAIEQAQQCFKKWGLITPGLQQHLDRLYHLGAMAAKPTGAGIGGYAISLWEKDPPQEAGLEFIEI